MRTSRMAIFIREYIGEQPPYLKVTHDKFKEIQREFEEMLLRDALRRCYGNQVKASNMLKMSRNHMRKLILKHGIDCKPYIAERPWKYQGEIYQRDPQTGQYL